jgi:hypothetical protein
MYIFYYNNFVNVSRPYHILDFKIFTYLHIHVVSHTYYTYYVFELATLLKLAYLLLLTRTKRKG